MASVKYIRELHEISKELGCVGKYLSVLSVNDVDDLLASHDRLLDALKEAVHICWTSTKAKEAIAKAEE